MHAARFALALLLVAGCAERVDLGGSPPSDCDASPPAPKADSAAEASVEPDASGAGAQEASMEADVSEAGSDAPVSDTGSETSAFVDAPSEVLASVYPAWCNDGVEDADETDVDCGGHCAPCGPRMGCLVDADCSATAAGCDVPSGGCYCDMVAFICVHSHCYDHVKDADESDGDCGGATCVLCAVGRVCASDADCASTACDVVSLACIGSQCTDHHQDGMESAVDCGGGCPSCAIGQHFATPAATALPATSATRRRSVSEEVERVREAYLVPALVLVAACGGIAEIQGPPTSDGGSLDARAAESGVDAPVADALATDALATNALATVALVADVLVADAVSDAMFATDAATDVASLQGDAQSGIGQACLTSVDCGSTPGCSPKNGCACDAVSMTCVFDHCFDHAKDGSETDVDCGDPLAGCTGCAVGKMCEVDGDCASQACDAISSTCAQTQCVDHRQDGLETAVDCGGGVCPECALAQGCRVDDDRMSAACDLVSFVCVQDQCSDHRQDGVETDIDCGGSVCVPRCQPTQGCNGNVDCAPGHICNSSHVCQ